MIECTDLPYRLTVISNKAASDSAQVEARSRAPRASATESKALQMAWPDGVYSLAHVAIPFAPDDPVYGVSDDPQGPYQGLPLGALQPRGETRLLSAPLSQLMRLRHNPFFTYVAQRIVEDIDSVLTPAGGGR